MGKHRHIKMSPRPVKIKSINMEKDIELSELELFFLSFTFSVHTVTGYTVFKSVASSAYSKTETTF